MKNTIGAVFTRPYVRQLLKTAGKRTAQLSLLAVLGLGGSLGTQSSVPSHANQVSRSQPVYARFRSFSGTVRVLFSGRPPYHAPSLNRYLSSSGAASDLIWVNGDSRSLARLQFSQIWSGYRQTVDPIVQAGPNRSTTRYWFPCRQVEGSSLVGWGVGAVGSAACEGIFVGSEPELGSTLAMKADPKTPVLGEHSIAQSVLDAQGFSVFRSSELTLLRIEEFDSEIVVDVLVGDALVKDAESRLNQVPAGNRYVYSRRSDGGDGSYTAIDPQQYAQSPEVQAYLDPVNWDPEVVPTINRYRVALGLDTEATDVPSVIEQRRQRLQNPGSGSDQDTDGGGTPGGGQGIP